MPVVPLLVIGGTAALVASGPGQKLIDGAFGLLNDAADFVTEDIVTPVAEAIGNNIVAPVGEIIGENIVAPVGQFVGETFIEPVGEFLGDYVLDPVEGFITDLANYAPDIIMSVGAAASGQWWMLPTLSGFRTAAEGGDLDDVLKSVGTAIVSQKVGQVAGDYIQPRAEDFFAGQVFQDATRAAQASAVVSEALTGGASQATTALILDEDPLEAFLRGGLSAGVSATLGQIDMDTGGKFTALPEAAQKTIANTTGIVIDAAGGAAAAALTGAELDKAIGNAVLTGKTATQLVSGYIGEYNKNTGERLSDIQVTALTSGILRTASAAVNDRNIAEAVAKSITNYGWMETYDAFSKSDVNQQIDDAFNKLTGAYQNVSNIVNKVTSTQKDLAEATEKYEGLVADRDKLFDKAEEYKKDTYDPARTRYQKALDSYNAVLAEEKSFYDPYKTAADNYEANPSQANTIAVNDAYNAYKAWKEKNDYTLGLNKARYELRLKTLEDASSALQGMYDNAASYGTQARLLAPTIEQYVNNLNAYETEYKNATDYLVGSTDEFDAAMKPIDAAVVKSVTMGLNPNFKAEEYAEINKLAPDVDPYEHWLTQGKEMGYATSYEEYDRYEEYRTYVDENGNLVITGGPPIEIIGDTTLADLRNKKYEDPVDFFDIVSKLSTSAKNDLAATADMFRVPELVDNTLDYIKESGNDEIKYTAAIFASAGGELLDSFNNLVIFAGQNPASTSAGKFAQDLIDLADELRPEKNAAALASMQERFANVDSISGAAKAIWGSFKDAPGTFLAEYIGAEIIQELPSLAVGFGVGSLAKGAATKLADNAAKELTERVGAYAAVSAAGALDVAESAGGAAGQAYDEAYATAFKYASDSGKGRAEAESFAQEYAYDLAVKAGTIAGVTTLVSMGVGGNALERAVLGDRFTGELGQAIGSIADKIKNGVAITIKEGVTEAIEEGLPTAFVETNLVQIDPDRPVAGNIALDSMMGAIAGSGTAGSIYAGDVAVRALTKFNPAAKRIIEDAPPTPEGAKQATDQLIQFGILDGVDLTGDSGSFGQQLLLGFQNEVYDEGYVTSQEAADIVTKEGYAPGEFDFSGYTGQVNQSQALASLKQLADAGYVTEVEANLLAKRATEAEGYSFTDAEIAAYIGKRNEATTGRDITRLADRNFTTRAELKNAAAAQNYTLSPEDYAKYSGQKVESSTLRNFTRYADPRAVTEEELRAAVAAVEPGYRLSASQIRRNTGNMNEKEILAEMQRLADVNYANEDEIRAAFEAEGYTPTDADIARYVGQKPESQQISRARKFSDPLAVIAEEVIEQYTSRGLEAPDSDFVQEYVGQYLEEELTERIRGPLTTAQLDYVQQALEDIGIDRDVIEQSIADVSEKLGVVQEELSADIAETEKAILDQVAEYEEAGIERDAALDQAISDVADDLGTTREELLTQIGKTEESLLTTIGEVEAGLTEDIAETEKAILDQVAEYEEAGIERDAALDQAISDVADDLGVAKADLLTQIGKTEESLLTALGETEEALSEDIQTVADLVGKPAREVTDVDIDFVADLIAQQEALTELTPEQVLYDVTGDQQITQADLDLLDQMQGRQTLQTSLLNIFNTSPEIKNQLQTELGMVTDIGTMLEVYPDLAARAQQIILQSPQIQMQLQGAVETQPELQTDINTALGTQIQTGLQPAVQSAFAPSGIYGQQVKTQFDIQQQAEQIAQQQAATQQAIQTQIQTEAERQKLVDFMQLGQMGAFEGRRVDITTPPPMQLQYIYDFGSIFANPQQASLFGSPYAEGGLVEDPTDEIMRILGDK